MAREEGQVLSDKERALIIWAALLALFLGALDALIMSAAMPSIVADLGGLPLYAWVYSTYFLARAVSLPFFGKLSDLYDTKKLFLLSISLFVVSSIAAGAAETMSFLIVSRVFQGIGAGGNFALVYIVLSEVAPEGKRAKTLALGSSVWGISSVIGPTLGGFIVTYFSWRWIFYINVPVGLLSLAGIGYFLHSPFNPGKNRTELDILGLFLFSSFILCLLVIFITGGRELAWDSLAMIILMVTTVVLGVIFYRVEKNASSPMIDLRFFSNRDFTFGNGAIFFASFTIFSFFAYAPIFIQGGLGLSPMQVGLAMVSLSLGWSFGAMFFGRFSQTGREKFWAVLGGGVLLAGSLMTIRFSLTTTMLECFVIFFVVGIGIGFTSLATLILVQNSVARDDLGVATSFHQLGRSLGGTIGVGICGGFVTTRLLDRLAETTSTSVLPAELLQRLQQGSEILLRPEFQALVPQGAVESLRSSVLAGVFSVFVLASLSSFACVICCLSLSNEVK